MYVNVTSVIVTREMRCKLLTPELEVVSRYRDPQLQVG